MDKNKNYKILQRELLALIEGIEHKIANLANASALLYNSLEDINWAGFYLLEDKDTLVLGPFQGKPACIEIKVGKGVCGTAAFRKETLVVANVHKFQGHIACDSASNSEIVVPIYNRDHSCILGVLDIDSPLVNRFDEADKAGLEEFVKILEQYI
jgi:GAF domain-containing protein